jgi:hypothetical protein
MQYLCCFASGGHLRPAGWSAIYRALVNLMEELRALGQKRACQKAAWF